jgi:ATPase subunit of ABC transporter with duplicated ATPase domains
VLAISHDRWFLDTVARRCIEIRDGRAEFYPGNYSFYVEERQRRFEAQMKKYEKDQAKYKQLARAAEQMHLWAFMGADKLHKRAFSMEKRMEKLAGTAKPTVQKKPDVRFAERGFFGDEVMLVEGLSKSFGDKRLFHDLDLLVEGGERIALLGDNGCGKSTFLKILTGEETPDAGRVRMGPSVRTACLPQIIRFEHPERTLYDTMLYEERCTPQSARDRLAQFQFTGETVFKPVSALSGGELSRLRLCRLMRRDINFLILDEPTNHLDIASREWIEDAVEDYGGALLFVSHDRWFIERFARRIWLLEDGEITDFKGTFSQFREYRARQAAIRQTQSRAEAPKKAPAAPKKPRSNPERRLARLEAEIEKLEAEIAALDRQGEAAASDYQRLLELDAEKQPLREKLDALYAQWEALSE